MCSYKSLASGILAGFVLAGWLASPLLAQGQGKFRPGLGQAPRPQTDQQTPQIRELPRVVGGYLGGSFVGNPGAGSFLNPSNQFNQFSQYQNPFQNPFLNPFMSPYQTPYQTTFSPNYFSPSPFNNPFMQNAPLFSNPWQNNDLFNPMNPFQQFPNQSGPYNPFMTQPFMQFPQNNPFQPMVNPWNNPWLNPWNNAPVVGVNNMFLGSNPGPVIGGGFGGFGGFGGGGIR